MENFSEKKKRGRPRSERRKTAEELVRMAMPGASTRTIIDQVYVDCIHAAIRHAGLEKDILGNHAGWPKGFKTAAIQVGKWVDAGGDEQSAFDVMAQARKDGISFGQIATHYKRLRLGEKQGTTAGVYLKLASAIDDYRKTFPKTTDWQIAEALDELRELFELEDDE